MGQFPLAQEPLSICELLHGLLRLPPSPMQQAAPILSPILGLFWAFTGCCYHRLTQGE